MSGAHGPPGCLYQHAGRLDIHVLLYLQSWYITAVLTCPERLVFQQIKCEGLVQLQQGTQPCRSPVARVSFQPSSTYDFR